MTRAVRPLEGIKVVEFSHMVLGPSCGLILADLGADVVKVEPAPEGDKTTCFPDQGPVSLEPSIGTNEASL